MMPFCKAASVAVEVQSTQEERHTYLRNFVAGDHYIEQQLSSVHSISKTGSNAS